MRSDGALGDIPCQDKMYNAQNILDFFKNWDLDRGAKAYIRFHCYRYALLLNTVQKIIDKIQNSGNHEGLKILDIGPSYQTAILRQDPGVIVNTLGFEDPRFKPRLQERHFEFDLNDSQFQERWLKIDGHDLIVMAEVIEHLYTSPKLVLACIATWLKNEGYLIIQTPNAVSLRRRLKMLWGKHPYEMIRETRTNPGHFREYTVDELVSIGRELEFVPIDYTIRNYFRHRGVRGWVYDAVCNFLPKGFRDGITICFQKGSAT